MLNVRELTAIGNRWNLAIRLPNVVQNDGFRENDGFRVPAGYRVQHIKMHTDIAPGIYFTKNAQSLIDWEEKPFHYSIYTKYQRLWIFMMKSKSPKALLSWLFSTLLEFCQWHTTWVVKRFIIASLQDAHRSIHRTVAITAPHVGDVAHTFRQVRLPLQEAIQRGLAALFVLSWPIESCHFLHNSRSREREEIGSGSSERSLAPPEVPGWSLHCFHQDSGRLCCMLAKAPQTELELLLLLAKSVISLPSEVASTHFSGSSGFAAGSALTRRTFLFWERSWSLRAIEHSPCVLVSLLYGTSDFSQSSWRSFFFHAASFMSSVILKSSVAAQEELVRTQMATPCCRHRNPFSSLRTTGGRDLAQSIRYLDFWSPIFWYQIVHPKVYFGFPVAHVREHAREKLKIAKDKSVRPGVRSTWQTDFCWSPNFPGSVYHLEQPHLKSTFLFLFDSFYN